MKCDFGGYLLLISKGEPYEEAKLSSKQSNGGLSIGIICQIFEVISPCHG